MLLGHMITSAEMLEAYKAGLLTHSELVNKLAMIAADVDPVSYIPDLPPHLSTAIRELVQDAPARPEDVFLLGSVTYNVGTDVAAAVNMEKQRVFHATQKLHTYFYGGPGDSGA